MNGRSMVHRSLAPIAIVILFVAPAAPARAQTTVTLLDYDAPRAGLRVGYGGTARHRDPAPLLSGLETDTDEPL